MNTKRGSVEPSFADDTQVVATSTNPGYQVTKGTKAPGGKHFDRLQSLMQEALDDNDEFSRRQALSIIDGFREALGVGRLEL